MEWKNIFKLKSEFIKVIDNTEYDIRSFDLGFMKYPMYTYKNSKCNSAVTAFTINTDERIYPCIVVNSLEQFCIIDMTIYYLSFGFVFQDVYLFDDTVKNNISFGNPNTTYNEIV